MPFRLAAAIVTTCLCCAPAAHAQTALTRGQRQLLQALVIAVDGASGPGRAMIDAAWQHHVLRTSDGSHYVAWTMTPPADAVGAGPLLIYTRLASSPPGNEPARAERSLVREWLLGSRVDPRLLAPKRGFAVGDMPAMGAGTLGGRGAATVGSADLQIMEMQRERARQRKADDDKQRRAALEGAGGINAGLLPFEDFDLIAAHDGGRAAIQRALTAGPGTYDLYIAWVDATQPLDTARPRVARSSLQLGPASAAELALSTIILADRIGVRAEPYNSLEQRAHPYAIGATEIVPSADTLLTPADQLSVAFQIVNPMASASGTPDVQVKLRLVRLAAGREEHVATLSPLIYDRTTLPPDFDVRLGHPLIAAMSAPLATIPRGAYRLLITAEDRVAGTVVAGATSFTVAGTPASLLAEAPPLGPRFDVQSALQPPVISAVIDRLTPPAPSPALARALQAARGGRFAELLVEDAVAPGEQGTRAALTGLGLLSLGNLGAIAQLERALQPPTEVAPVRFLLGAARALQNRDADAIDSWQAARRLGFPRAVIDRFLADAYLRGRNFQAAANAIEASGDGAAARTFAATRMALGKEGDAVAMLDGVLSRSPDDHESRWLLVHALYSEYVRGRRDQRDRLITEARRYIAAAGPHAALASEWLAVVTSS